jgi:hypothetical protein
MERLLIERIGRSDNRSLAVAALFEEFGRCARFTDSDS